MVARVSPELHSLSPNLAVWSAYNPAVKADLFSTAISTSDGIFLIDPILLGPDQLQVLANARPVAGIFVTNQNHWRAAPQLSKQLSVPIFADPEAAVPDETTTSFSPVAEGQVVGGSLRVISIEGAGQGEIALYSEDDAGVVVIGDALINFAPYGFDLLPQKYCLNQKNMRKALQRLMECSFQRMFFAHGMPIMSEAKSRLGSLLATR